MRFIYSICILFAIVFLSHYAVAQTVDSIAVDVSPAQVDSVQVNSSATLPLPDEFSFEVKEDTTLLKLNKEESKAINSENIILADDSTLVIDDRMDEVSIDQPFYEGEEYRTTNYSDTVIVGFVKGNVIQSPDSLYFNVLRVVNYKDIPVRGELLFTAPDGWNIISASGNVINLAPQDSAFIPIRLAVDKEVAGAFSYILNATFKIENEMFSTNAYITIPGVQSWKMNVDKSIIVFNPYSEEEDVKIKLSNKGNTTETVKLEFRVGDLIVVDGVDEFSRVKYVTLNNGKDTTINLRVKYNNSISFEEREFLQRNWKETSVDIQASTFDKKQKHVIWFKRLNSSYYGTKFNASSPLNLGITASNLLSGQSIRFNVNVFGALLLSKNRNLNYALSAIGFSFNSNELKTFKYKRNIKFSAGYSKDRVNVLIGNNISAGAAGVGISGLGFRTNYKFKNKSQITFGAATSLYSKNSFGGSIRYSKNILGVGIRAGVAYANYSVTKKEYCSALFGFNFKFLKFNSLGVNVFKTSSSISNFFAVDSTMSGLGYSLAYGFGIKRFSLTTSFQNYISYTRKIGQGVGIASSYSFNNRIKVTGRFDRSKKFIDISRYNLGDKEMYNIYDYGRASINVPTNHSVSYSLGPQYNGVIQQSLDRKNKYISTTSTYNPKLSISATRRLTKRTSINGAFSVGLAFINYISEDSSIVPIRINSKGTYSFSTSYNSRNWRLNVAYNIGSVTDLWSYLNYHMMFPTYDIGNIMTESILIRPVYEKSFLQNRIHTQLMANYTFYMPSSRESIVLSSNNSFNLNKGWTGSINLNMYMGSVSDNETRLSSKNVNIQLGVRKSFDIQQPRLKHYNLTLVCFNDLNGNKIKDENEPPMPNILVSIERTSRTEDVDLQNQLKTNFALIELITSPDGESFYSNIPEGNYRIVFKPLFDIKDLYNVNGEEQIVSILSTNTTLFVPYAETYKIKGKVHVERDEFSSEGTISPEGIRVTATNPTGESFSVLTDKNGDYVLAVPQAQTYLVKVNNVFNDQFICEKDNYSVHFNGIKVIKIDFKFIEKKRKINFNTNIDQFYIFQSLSSTQVPNQKEGIKSFKTDIDTSNVLQYIDAIMDSKAFVKPEKIAKQKEEIPVTKVKENGLIFKVQLYNEGTQKRTRSEVKSFPQVICVDGNDGGFIYLSGSYKSFETAKEFADEIVGFGLNEAKVVAYKDGVQITLEEAGVK